MRTLTPGAKAPSSTAVAAETCDSASDALFSILWWDSFAITASWVEQYWLKNWGKLVMKSGRDGLLSQYSEKNRTAYNLTFSVRFGVRCNTIIIILDDEL